MNDNIIDKVVDAIDIVEVISESVELVSKGKNFVGLCPFHQDNNPSFTVSPDKRIYKCFVCENGGNVITFYQRFNNISFQESLQTLAGRANIMYRTRPKVSATPEQEILDETSKFYNTYLSTLDESLECREYLNLRGITQDLVDRFMFGYAPFDTSISYNYVSSVFEDKYGDFNFEESGNFSNERDFFKERLMIPIRNELGYTVGFSARALGDSNPKYLNSRDSKVFNKGSVLYNLDLARNNLGANKELIVVEGFFDVVTFAKFGVDNVVATMGTSFTVGHVELLKKVGVKKVILGFDQDKAGQKATYKAGAFLIKHGFLHIEVLFFDGAKDVDELLQTEDVKLVLKQTFDFFMFKINFLKGFYDFSSIEDQTTFIKNVTKGLESQEKIKQSLIQNEIKSLVPMYEPKEYFNNVSAFSDSVDTYYEEPDAVYVQPKPKVRQSELFLSDDACVIRCCMYDQIIYETIKVKVVKQNYKFKKYSEIYELFEQYYEMNTIFDLFLFIDYNRLTEQASLVCHNIYYNVIVDFKSIDAIFSKNPPIPGMSIVRGTRR